MFNKYNVLPVELLGFSDGRVKNLTYFSPFQTRIWPLY